MARCTAARVLPGIGLRVVVRDLDLTTEDAALGVDVGDREIDAVPPVGAGGGACARQFDDVDELDLFLRRRPAGRSASSQRGVQRSIDSSLILPPSCTDSDLVPASTHQAASGSFGSLRR